MVMREVIWQKMRVRWLVALNLGNIRSRTSNLPDARYSSGLKKIHVSTCIYFLLDTCTCTYMHMNIRSSFVAELVSREHKLNTHLRKLSTENSQLPQASYNALASCVYCMCAWMSTLTQSCKWCWDRGARTVLPRCFQTWMDGYRACGAAQLCSSEHENHLCPETDKCRDTCTTYNMHTLYMYIHQLS